MALGSGTNMTPKCGHPTTCHVTSYSPATPTTPWGGLKVLEGNLFLLRLVQFCVLFGAKHRPGPMEGHIWDHLVSGLETEWQDPQFGAQSGVEQGLWVLPGRRLSH